MNRWKYPPSMNFPTRSYEVYINSLEHKGARLQAFGRLRSINDAFASRFHLRKEWTIDDSALEHMKKPHSPYPLVIQQ